MRPFLLPCLLVLCSALLPARAQTDPISSAVLGAALGDRAGAVVVIDCRTGQVHESDPGAAAEKLPPCSTFKIWNTLIGLESGIVKDPDAPFYQWDGETRFLPDWNKDLTLAEAFRVSCVPAFQQLARQLGKDRMQAGVDKIGYGDRDISAGIDVFWLPAKDRKTILITPRQQADLMAKLATRKLPFSAKSMDTLKEIMRVKASGQGTLFGKTGSGADTAGKYNLGWFVGYVDGADGGHAFACMLKGDGISGKDARALVEKIFEAAGKL